MAQLKPDDDSTLMFSVALWLQNRGFSKVLKRFLAAAEIQDDDWKSKALNLNEVFSKYLEISNSICKDLKFQEKQEEQVAVATDKTEVANGTISEEVTGKKKKKKSKDEPAVNKSGKPLEDTTMTEKINGSHENGSKDESYEVSKKSNGDKVPELAEDQATKKPNEKKKKKNKLVSQSLDAEAAEDVVDESKKASKKRKRMASDEKENQSGQEVAIEESKSKKSKGLEEGTHVPPLTAFPGSNGHAGEQEKVDTLQIDNSSQKKSASKQPKSSEPKSVIAFQRVKIDEVEFVDERLQDNSYWAKDGAETGYGAKAQEVLGQVKGRGFRHEKTKKKRGSYRGGQIDLQSHSIKFKDSDEE